METALAENLTLITGTIVDSFLVSIKGEHKAQEIETPHRGPKGQLLTKATHHGKAWILNWKGV